MRDCVHPLEALLPHRAPMILLDQVTSYDETALIASVTITESSMFCEGDGVPGYVAIEYMAQACGAFVGAQALESGAPVKIGFLVGTRNCRILMPQYRIGDRLMVTVAIVFHDEQMAAFDCRIEVDGKLAADAQLKVYQPDDAQLLAGQGEER